MPSEPDNLETPESDHLTVEQVLPLVYDELRRIAASQMAQEGSHKTLQATALVHEAWLKLEKDKPFWKNRKQFMCVAAEAMRRILVDRARKRGRLKRGGDMERVPLDQVDVAIESDTEQIIKVHEALEKLAMKDPMKAQLIKLRFFAGLKIPEAADVLGISTTTAKRHWTFARVWLLDQLNDSQ